MDKLKFRDASLSDLEKIVKIYNSTIPSRMVTADTENVSVESRLEWFKEHNTQTRPLWMIEDENDQVLGWVSFSSFYGRPAYNGTVELSIYMDESCRGKGIGKKVLKYCMDHAGKFGVKTLLGFIFSHNEPSLKLFRYFGFEDWGNLPNVAVLDGEEKSLIILGKRIAV
ncbi:GNAT family N-acetyltransferase [Chryseobacterium sp.]|uniref:GNAT family N-acetyltransferase n=1 Tax=Chryseobacterium sp. TaxID=1871047 RepID=UPI0025C181A8|nr:GNAT family N-acetyltransferase [Chryseobacterium sp.]